MNELSFQDRLVYSAALCFRWMMGILPLPVFVQIRDLLANLYCLFGRRDRHIILANIELTYGLAKHSFFARSFAKQCMQSTVRSGLETIRANVRFTDAEILGAEKIRKILFNLPDERPAIIITSHLGAWELAGTLVAKHSEREFFGLAKPSKNPGFSLFLENIRRNFGIKVIWTGRKSLVKDMMNVLHRGGLLGFVMDQKPQGNLGPEVIFFRQNTPFVSGPASMALHFQCPVYSLHLIRVGTMRFQLVMTEIVYQPDISAHSLTAVMAANLEQLIRQYPEQWCWNYRRWKFS